MKTYLRTQTSTSYKEWVVAFTPCLYIARHDVFHDEAAYRLGFIWLIFQIEIIFTRKIEEIPTGECNISVDEK